MTDLEKIGPIFAEALGKKDPHDRVAYLEEVCRDDPDLREKMEILLKAHEKAGDFLESPPFLGQAPLNDHPAESPGTVIDKYKLLEKIGEGGMAVVYMAEQQEPVRRQVALKIVKLGMDTKQVIARFEAERQALAMMDHPNIAKVLDAGATETGRPYFVMDLVKGIPITTYCDENNLSMEERLRLFMPVCEAIQHAHQKGIIHRDIKTTNVLVQVDNGRSIPKVIDFGIAKAINQKLTEKTLFTRFEQLVGTPEYMSPEQAEWGAMDIDTRTDIYSLGVLLYELLTGTTPFDAQKLREAGYNRMLEIIQQEEPTKPSTKLDTVGETLTDIATHRKSTPGGLKRLLHGDLDWIIMKALEKDRTRRYATASELAADVERHLRHEPVLAAGPSAMYRARKFVRKHRAGVTASLAVMVALFIGATASTVGFLQANSQRILAEAQHQQAEANLDMVLQSLDKILLKIPTETDSSLHETFRVLKMLVSEFPTVSDFRGDLLKCYVELASYLKAGDTEAAESSYQDTCRVIELLRDQVRDLPSYQVPIALIHCDLAMILEKSGDGVKARYHYRQAVVPLERLVSGFPDVPAYHVRLAGALSFLATSAETPQSDEFCANAFDHIITAVGLSPEEAGYRKMLVQQSRQLNHEDSYKRTITLLESVLHIVPESRHELAAIYSDLSVSLRKSGLLDESLVAQRHAEAYWQELTAPLGNIPYTFGTPVPLEAGFNTEDNEGAPRERADGLERFTGSDRAGGHGHYRYDLWVATRTSTSDEWSNLVNLGPVVNSPYPDTQPSISTDGLELYFSSDRPEGLGSVDIWVTRRPSLSDPWSKPRNLGSPVNTSWWDGVPHISSDGLVLLFDSRRPGGCGGADIWQASRPNRDSDWGDPVNLGPVVNSPTDDGGPCISADGLTLFFASYRQGGFGSWDVWMTTRPTATSNDWGKPVNLGPTVNSPAQDFYSAISADGSTLYITSDREEGYGHWDAWAVPIHPVNNTPPSRSDLNVRGIK